MTQTYQFYKPSSFQLWNGLSWANWWLILGHRSMLVLIVRLRLCPGPMLGWIVLIVGCDIDCKGMLHQAPYWTEWFWSLTFDLIISWARMCSSRVGYNLVSVDTWYVISEALMKTTYKVLSMSICDDSGVWARHRGYANSMIEGYCARHYVCAEIVLLDN